MQKIKELAQTFKASSRYFIFKIISDVDDDDDERYQPNLGDVHTVIARTF